GATLGRGDCATAWRPVAARSRECGCARRCPFRDQCSGERARAEAAEADIVVTNHALLAIDALSDVPVLPEHDCVVIDEAHELESRITSTATAELSPTNIAILAKRTGKIGPDGTGDALTEALDEWVSALDGAVA